MDVGLESPAGCGQAPVASEHGSAGAGGHQHLTAAVVVLYHPDAAVLQNLACYADQVDHVYVVDNTECPEEGLEAALGAFRHVTYLPNGANLGIATGLNIGVRAALAEGYPRVLTMDQDSTAPPGLVQALGACMDSDPAIALVSPVHQQVGGLHKPVGGGCRDVPQAMTSGNLLRGDAFQDVGGFMEELFIDQVDNEFCLKLRRAGYRVVEAGQAVLHHRVGRVRRHRFPFPCFSTNHSAVRRYYMARNRLVVGARYRADHPEYLAFELGQLAREVVKIILHEPQKCLKLRMILRGILDFRRGVLGPYPQERSGGPRTPER